MKKLYKANRKSCEMFLYIGLKPVKVYIHSDSKLAKSVNDENRDKSKMVSCGLADIEADGFPLMVSEKELIQSYGRNNPYTLLQDRLAFLRYRQSSEKYRRKHEKHYAVYDEAGKYEIIDYLVGVLSKSHDDTQYRAVGHQQMICVSELPRIAEEALKQYDRLELPESLFISAPEEPYKVNTRKWLTAWKKEFEADLHFSTCDVHTESGMPVDLWAAIFLAEHDDPAESECQEVVSEEDVDYNDILPKPDPENPDPQKRIIVPEEITTDVLMKPALRTHFPITGSADLQFTLTFRIPGECLESYVPILRRQLGNPQTLTITYLSCDCNKLIVCIHVDQQCDSYPLLADGEIRRSDMTYGAVRRAQAVIDSIYEAVMELYKAETATGKRQKT